MTVHGAIVFIPHFVKHIGADQTFFQAFLEMMDAVIERPPDTCGFGCGTPSLFDLIVARLLADIGEMLCHRADVRHNGHAVVIENHNQRFPAGTGVVQALIGQSPGQRTVSHQRNDIIVFPPQRSRTGHTKRNGDRIGGMAGNESVMHALAWFGKACKSIELSQRWKTLRSSSQKLMDVGLVTHIENQSILGSIKNTVNGNRKLHNA